MSAYVKVTDDSNATFMALKDYFKNEGKYEKISDISFSSERKWSSVTFKDIGTIIVGLILCIIDGTLILAVIFGSLLVFPPLLTRHCVYNFLMAHLGTPTFNAKTE